MATLNVDMGYERRRVGHLIAGRNLAPHNYAALIFSSGSKMAGLMAGLIGELECPFIVG